MKMMSFILVFLLGVNSLFATNYYISAKGKNTNAGTSIASAWRTTANIDKTHFLPGDSILFEGGKTFSGYIWLQGEDSGNALHPIVISSYGTGRATIDGGNSFGMYAYNTGGIEVRNLNFVGSGPAMNTNAGVLFYTDSAGNRKFKHIVFADVTIHGFGSTGLTFGSYAKSTGYEDVLLERMNVYDNKLAGITSYSEGILYRKAHRNVVIRYCNVYSNRGDSTYMASHSGNGIVIGGATNVLIEHCIAHDNGDLCFCKTAGPAGLWVYECDSAAIRYCESYHNRRSGGVDGDGFDIDIYTSNSVMEYNYSHDNEGVGYLFTQWINDYTHRNNVIRFNISQNDGVGILLYGPFRDAQIYNNTVYSSQKNPRYGFPSYHAFWALNYGFANSYSANVFVRNNIFYLHGAVTAVELGPKQNGGDSNVFFQGNVFYNDSGVVSYVQNGKIYYSLNDWRKIEKQEMLGVDSTGIEKDPQLIAPGTGKTIGNADSLMTLKAYMLRDSSYIRGKGLNMDSLLGISSYMVDYFGDSIRPTGQFSPGVHEPQKSIISNVAEASQSNEFIRIYPDPAKDVLSVELKGDHELKIYSSTGQIILRDKISDKAVLNISHFPPGIYFIQMEGKYFRKFFKL